MISVLNTATVNEMAGEKSLVRILPSISIEAIH